MAAKARVLFASDLARVTDFSCDAPASGCGRERCGPVSSVTIMRRGVHAYHGRGRTALAEAGLALLYRGGETYRLSHPYHRDVPDRSTCVEFGDALLDEAFGAAPLDRDLGVHLGPRTQLLNHRTVAGLDGAGLDRAAGEEAAMALIEAVAADFHIARADAGRPEPARRRARRAREFIASQPAADLGLADIANAAATSPFHLARLFKRHTGLTIRGYRMRLRLAAALERIAEGERDLARLAAELGFSHHSHLSSAFRRHLGATPSDLRERLSPRRLREMRKFLTA